MACPFCDLIVRADAPDTMPRGIAESTKNLYSWVGYPALPPEVLEGEVPPPDGPDYECRVRCPNCGRQPEFIGRFDPIWASEIVFHAPSPTPTVTPTLTPIAEGGDDE